MKKTLLLLSFAVGIFSANAQITVTSADVATPVKVILQANDSTPTISVGTASGLSQSWNMTGLHISSTDTLNFIPYNWAPDTNFTSSNLVMKQGTSSNYSYMNNSSTGLTTLGNAGVQNFGNGPVTVHQLNSPAEILMQFSATYGTSYTNNFTTTTPAFYFGIDPGIGFTVDYVRSKSTVKKTVMIDAWGSLQTPLGTFNVIRSKETIVKYDSIDGNVFGAWVNNAITRADSTTGYTWWAKNIGFPLVSVKLDSLGALKKVQWLKALPLVGIEEYANQTKVKTYPNPAQNQIVFDVDADKVNAVTIYDVTGQLIESSIVLADKVKINTTNYSNGIYSYSIFDKNKNILNRGKFSVVK